MVWDTTVKIVEEMFSVAWRDQETITVDHCVDITLPVSSLVLRLRCQLKDL